MSPELSATPLIAYIPAFIPSSLGIYFYFGQRVVKCIDLDDPLQVNFVSNQSYA